MNTDKIYWLFHRLRAMSLCEVAYRLGNKAQAIAQHRGFFTDSNPPRPDFHQKSSNWIHVPNSVNSLNYIEKAENILSGNFRIFALADCAIGPTPAWNTDPLTKISVQTTFGKTLDYRNPSLVGDIKYLWEINRHLQLVALAQAYALTRDERWLAGLRHQLESWLDQCPYLMGPNWTSSLELGIRLINWSIAWQLAGGVESPMFMGQDGHDFRARFMASVHQHMSFISGWFSRYSSANNHLIGEAAGLFIGSVTWPFWRDTEKWKKTALDILHDQALRQNSADGVNLEQAVSYQQFVLDFLILSRLAGAANNIVFSRDYDRRINAMLDYVGSIMDVGRNIPMIGDADDGYVTSLSPEPDFCPYRSLLATGSQVFQRGDLLAKAAELDHKTLWLIKEPSKDLPESEMDIWPRHQAFKQGGYYILGQHFEAAREVKVVADAGPLGMSPLAAHGHADALGFTMSLYGREFIIDPGTYSYHTKRKWRDYFRSTRAHNTVEVDGVSQSVIRGNFMWDKHYRVFVEDWSIDDDIVRLVAGHDGYTRLDDPLVHKREFALERRIGRLVITDFFQCEKEHVARRYLHLCEDCQVRRDNDGLSIINGGHMLELYLGEEADVEIVKGDVEAPLGWVSRSFDVKLPTNTIVIKNTITNDSVLQMTLDWSL